MKREGRQHGMVRTHSILPPPWNLRRNSKIINRLGSPPTVGLFTKVSSKPSNHSKFTSRCCGRPRCEGCHEHPAYKSKDKTKGTQKLRSYDVDKNHRLIAWQLVDKGHGMNFGGISATGILDHLSSNYYNDEGEDEIIDVYDDSVALVDGLATKSRRMEEEAGIGYGGIEIGEADDIDEGMGFCNVGFVMDEEDGEEGWCLVGEM